MKSDVKEFRKIFRAIKRDVKMLNKHIWGAMKMRTAKNKPNTSNKTCFHMCAVKPDLRRKHMGRVDSHRMKMRRRKQTFAIIRREWVDCCWWNQMREREGNGQSEKSLIIKLTREKRNNWTMRRKIKPDTFSVSIKRKKIHCFVSM